VLALVTRIELVHYLPIQNQGEGTMQVLRRSLAIFLCFASLTWAQGNTFDRVRYNGGSVPSKVDAKDWGNKLTVTSDTITLALKDGQKLDIAPKSVTALSYGQEAHRRVGTMIALAVLVAPIALFGLLHKTRLHFIGIQYKTPDGKPSGILLQGDKENYRAILVALQGVTGVPVSVAEKDREFVPVGVTADVVKGSEEKTQVAESTSAPQVESSEKGTVNVASNPDGGDVYVDGAFVGNSPASLKLSPGKHTVMVKASGYKDWSRDVTVESGSEVHLTAALDKAP
jgi:hypothetical protein